MDGGSPRDELGERICHELERIANVLEVLMVTLVPEPPTPPPSITPTCPHPPESRIDFGTTQGQSDWQCRICGYRTPSL